ncbi:UNVERIFIED_CONTAM: hypothetical protein K2H54_018350 [Gekko kuhli]
MWCPSQAIVVLYLGRLPQGQGVQGPPVPQPGPRAAATTVDDQPEAEALMPFCSFSPTDRNKRDADFAQRKAERAAMRAHLREKYQLPKSRTDKKQMEAVGGKVTVPQDLLAIVKSKTTSDAGSLFPSFSDLNFSSFQMTARNAMRSLQHPVQCPVM